MVSRYVNAAYPGNMFEYYDGDTVPADAEIFYAATDYDAIVAELETEHMRLAGCGVAALADTPESMASQRLSIDSPYWSASYGDVLRRVQECIDLRARIATLEAELKFQKDLLSAYHKQNCAPKDSNAQ